jgi:recombination protein RecR
MADSLQHLVSALGKLPSVGEKSAWRMAMYILENREVLAGELSRAVDDAAENMRRCDVCNTWCEEEVCAVCSSSRRDETLLCIVEKPQDMWSIERESSYTGVYHVLGGLLSPMKGVMVSSLFLHTLKNRIRQQNVTEVIIGLGGSGEAETTFHYILKLLESIDSLRISRFARGLSAGMEIDYADKRTLDTALGERRTVYMGEKI